MSDLLPLVATVLKDKVAVDAQNEITHLRDRLNLAQAVEIICTFPTNSNEGEDFRVYASGSFVDGNYSGNPNLFQVDLKPQNYTCKLSELRGCQICVGGGFPVASLDDLDFDNPPFEVIIASIEDEDSDEKVFRLCFSPNTIWLEVVVKGWPKSAWQTLVEEDPDWESGEGVAYLVDQVSPKFPEATVEFTSVCFVAKNIQSTIKRLIPAKRLAMLEQEKNERLNDPENIDFGKLFEFTARGLRIAGDNSGPALFLPKIYEILECLGTVGVRAIDGVESVVSLFISVYHEGGRTRLDCLVRRMLNNRLLAREGDIINTGTGNNNH